MVLIRVRLNLTLVIRIVPQTMLDNQYVHVRV
jgi:hypothetical protein